MHRTLAWFWAGHGGTHSHREQREVASPLKNLEHIVHVPSALNEERAAPGRTKGACQQRAPIIRHGQCPNQQGRGSLSHDRSAQTHPAILHAPGQSAAQAAVLDPAVTARRWSSHSLSVSGDCSTISAVGTPGPYVPSTPHLRPPDSNRTALAPGPRSATLLDCPITGRRSVRLRAGNYWRRHRAERRLGRASLVDDSNIVTDLCARYVVAPDG